MPEATSASRASHKSWKERGWAGPVRYAFAPTSLGVALVAGSDRGVCALLLGERENDLFEDLQQRFPKIPLVTQDATFAATVALAVQVVDGALPAAHLSLDACGTSFQHKVWEMLRSIPPGATLSYTALAARLRTPAATRAVAQACAANPVAVAIPCHRAIREDGKLAGYRWGLARKRALLQREGS